MEFENFAKDRIYLQRLLEILRDEKIYFFPIKVRHIDEPLLDLNKYCSASIGLSLDNFNPSLELLYDDLNRYGDQIEISIAHELGHFYNRKTKSFLKRVRLDNIYNKLDDGFYLSKRERDAVIQEEIEAWNLGYKVLVNIGFENFTEFFNYRASCLESYKEK